MMNNIGSVDSRSVLTGIKSGDIQPNAVDLRIGKILKIVDRVFVIDDGYKGHRGSVEMHPDAGGYWFLEPGDYEVVMENKVTVSEGEAGWVITRSTLNRNGVFLTSGLYDSGYSGVMAACMHVGVGPMRIAKGTRVGQYLSYDAQTLGMYDGDYGDGSSHDAKYEGNE